MRTQNPSDLLTPKASTIARKYVHADLNLTFIPNPITGDINPVKDIEAIKNSVKNLIMTNFQERPFQPEIGSGIRALLFEPVDTITAHELEEAIKDAEETIEFYMIKIFNELDELIHEITSNNGGGTYA